MQSLHHHHPQCLVMLCTFLLLASVAPPNPPHEDIPLREYSKWGESRRRVQGGACYVYGYFWRIPKVARIKRNLGEVYKEK
jgi:hypothetical protein